MYMVSGQWVDTPFHSSNAIPLPNSRKPAEDEGENHTCAHVCVLSSPVEI